MHIAIHYSLLSYAGLPALRSVPSLGRGALAYSCWAGPTITCRKHERLPSFPGARSLGKGKERAETSAAHKQALVLVNGSTILVAPAVLFPTPPQRADFRLGGPRPLFATESR